METFVADFLLLSFCMLYDCIVYLCILQLWKSFVIVEKTVTKNGDVPPETLLDFHRFFVVLPFAPFLDIELLPPFVLSQHIVHHLRITVQKSIVKGSSSTCIPRHD